MPGSGEIQNFNVIKNRTNLYLGPTKFMINEKYNYDEYKNILNKYLKTFDNDAAFHAIDSETIYKIISNIYKESTNFVKNIIIRIEHGTEFIPEFYKKSEFIQITSAGAKEAHPQEVKIIKEEPKYQILDE